MTYSGWMSWVFGLAVWSCAGWALAVDGGLPASKDNTLYEDANGTLSNGAGEYLFAGRVGQAGGATIRRTLIAFDVSAIPAGAVITNATLTMNMSKSTSGLVTVSLHKVTADWGEGASNADLEEGQGAPAAANDATWTKRFFGTSQDWTAPGGDFISTASGSASVNLTGSYNWNSAGILADVISWYNTPASNFGWVVRGDEALIGSAKRFDSSESLVPQNRPVLTITYTPQSVIPDWTVY